MRRVIEVTNENRKFLMKAFDVTSVMVWYALSFNERRGQSELAKKIRFAAIKRGGRVMNYVPECECIHDSDGCMKQYYGDRVVIVCDKVNDTAVLLKDGSSCGSWKHITMPKLAAIQAQAEALAGVEATVDAEAAIELNGI